ncbi:MAG: HAMP domain-containing sensor histidine kinase [Nocardioidaceae bacterium]
MATLVITLLVSTALVAVVTSLAMRGYLGGQLDAKIGESLGRAVDSTVHGVPPTQPQGSPDDGHGGSDGDEPPGRFARAQEPGTLIVVYAGTDEVGGVVTSSGSPRRVSSSVLRAVRAVPVDERVHTVHLPGLGEYRVKTAQLPGGVVAAGLPTREVNGTVAKLVGSEVLLGLLVVLAAGVVGWTVVRRQLKPLREVAATAHEVAAMPLKTGEIGETIRVPEDLTDERTEVGQVGSALNTMLAHIEEALDARHRSEQQVRQFVADASHELRTPLSTIQGYAELTRRTASADPAALGSAMTKVESEAQRMAGLVDDLLLLARLDAGRPLERREVDLTRLALEAVGDARVLAPDHRWALDLPEEPLTVTGDEQRLHQVLTNLLTNARRHTPPGTTVTVATRADGDHVLLTVHDNGPGLPPALVGRVFERFTRGDSSRTRASGGAGLGLSLVQAITAAHGGSVSVASVPGDTTFTVRLPR